jgi:hypothetical protein
MPNPTRKSSALIRQRYRQGWPHEKTQIEQWIVQRKLALDKNDAANHAQTRSERRQPKVATCAICLIA